MPRQIDIRSDTVTQPTTAMREAMLNAEVGDDVYGEDPTVNELQKNAAGLLGHEAALFMPTGTQSNLVALLTHCQRGDEYITGADAHTFKYEGGGAAGLGGVQPQTIAFDKHGGLALDDIARVIKKRDDHFARTRLICLENTQHGRVQSLASMAATRDFAHARGLAIHLDGARMANAAVALGVTLKDIGECFDTVSLCLSKGLGAPVGSLLFGSTDFIREAKRWRKVCGGGMRQSGLLAAAGWLALTDGLERLHEDHEHAATLADLLEGIPGAHVRPGWTMSNMVWLDFDIPLSAEDQAALLEMGRAREVRLSLASDHSRIVLHRDIRADDLPLIADVFKTFFTTRPERQTV